MALFYEGKSSSLASLEVWRMILYNKKCNVSHLEVSFSFISLIVIMQGYFALKASSSSELDTGKGHFKDLTTALILNIWIQILLY